MGFHIDESDEVIGDMIYGLVYELLRANMFYWISFPKWGT